MENPTSPEPNGTALTGTEPTSVDLNADVGESYGRWSLGDDESLFALVSSANVACGAHAGDATTMRRSCELAVRHGVRVGAQIGYRDLAGFGRRFVDIDGGELADDVVAQIGALAAAARVAGTQVSYVKPHGALYNAVVTHEAQAAAVVDAVRSYDPALAVVGLPGSALLRLAARAGLAVVREGFADRAYTAEGTLVDRRRPGAVLHDPAVIARRVVRMVRDGVVDTVPSDGAGPDGGLVELAVDTICLHGDTPGAVEMARAVHEALAAAGRTVRA